MLKCLKRQVSLNPPKKTYLHYPPPQSRGQDSPTDRTDKVTNTLQGSGRRGYNDDAASAASVVKLFNGGGFVERVLAPFNEVVDL